MDELDDKIETVLQRNLVELESQGIFYSPQQIDAMRQCLKRKLTRDNAPLDKFIKRINDRERHTKLRRKQRAAKLRAERQLKQINPTQ